jgi:hypothetical protein
MGGAKVWASEVLASVGVGVILLMWWLPSACC